jgi:hypothetical protein
MSMLYVYVVFMRFNIAKSIATTFNTMNFFYNFLFPIFPSIEN